MECSHETRTPRVEVEDQQYPQRPLVHVYQHLQEDPTSTLTASVLSLRQGLYLAYLFVCISTSSYFQPQHLDDFCWTLHSLLWQRVGHQDMHTPLPSYCTMSPCCGGGTNRQQCLYENPTKSFSNLL